MAGGYVLALVPAALIVIGAIIAVYHIVRRPSAEIFLLVSFAGALLAAQVLLSLYSAAYSAVKGFYGLSALVPISFFAALGWHVVTRSRPISQGILACLLLIWAANSFASVWIRDSAARGTYPALQLRADKKLDAAVSELSKAVDADPADVTSRRYLASFLAEAGRPFEALVQARLAVNLRPDDGANHVHLAAILARQGQTVEAVAVALRARELAPENPFVYEALVALLLQEQRSREAVDLGREGLCVTPSSAVLHERLAEAFVREQDFAAAARHREYARILRMLEQ
jgi:tetratricopeptide (TPR) repeat protein